MSEITTVVRLNSGLYKKIKIKLHAHSTFTTHNVAWADEPTEGEYYAIVRKDTDEGLLASYDQVRLFAAISAGEPLSSAIKEASCDKTEAEAIIAAATNANFFKKIDKYDILDRGNIIHPWFSSISNDKFRIFIHPLLLVCTGTLIIFALGTLLRHPQLFPTVADYVWSKNILLVVMQNFVIALLLKLIHEGAHFVTTRAVGAQANIKFFNTRFLNLVLETNNFHLLLVPRNKRVLVYLSGMCIDLVIFGLATILLFLNEQHYFLLGQTTKALLNVIMLTEITSVIWQFNIYLQTDMYNYLSDQLSENNLYANTQKYIGKYLQKSSVNILRRISPIFLSSEVQKHSDTLTSLTKRDLKYIHGYAILLSLGIVFLGFDYLYLILYKDCLYLLEIFYQYSENIIVLVILGAFIGYPHVLLTIIVWNKMKTNQSIF